MVTKGEPVVTESKAQDQIIRVGTMTEGKHSHEEKIPFKYEIEYDSNLKAGEYVVDVEGKEGSRTTEWTIKNSKVVEGSASVTKEEAATNAKIRVGNKNFVGNISHEVTEEIPYDVVIEEDPTMIAGTSEVVTEGKAGSKTTKYTQGIKNGEADGELKSEVTSTTNPVQQVIKVGTKPAENNKDYSKDVDVKVEYIYDENLDKGVVKLGELTKGKVETKIVNKYDPKTGEVTTTEEEIVTEATQKIIVGTKDFTGTYKYEKTCPLPFEVTITEDPNLAKGEKVVDQEGQAGSKTTYYEQDIKNGQPDGEARELTEKTTIQEPKNHIVRIGTKVAESSTVKTVDREIPFETKYIYDDTMDAGSEKVESEGKVGKEKVTITTKITDGTGEASEETKTITEKEDRVVRIGTKPVTKVVEKPFNTKYVYDENLESGKTEEVTPGKNGKVTITTTYDKDQKKVVTTETEEAGQNRVVKIGGKTNGTHTYTNKKPFDVEVRVNPELPKGEHNVIQEGVEGEEEVTVTIENSKVTETSEPKETKAPVNEIIEVGSEDYTGTFETKKTSPVEFETEYVVDNSLEPGTTVVDQEGSLGEETTTVTHKIENGKVVESTEGEKTQTKAPTKRIVKVGPAKTDGTHTYTNKKPFDVEVRVNPELAKGEYNVIQEGVEGEEEVTVTIENSKVTETSEPKETKAPVNEIIEIGSEDYTGEVTHTEHFEIPFEVEVRYNDELPAGTSKEIQKGEKGSYDMEYKQAIKNGQADGEMTKTESNRKEAKKHIIEVGTKVDTPENKYSKDVEVEIEYVYDDTKDKGVVETGELTPGKVETKVVNKYNPETGEIEQTTEEVVTKAKQKVIVGTKDFTGTYEYEDTCPVPFEVEIIEDDTLAKGEKVVDQEGKPGSKTTKYEQDIKNGKPDGKRRVVEETTTEEPTKHVVRVGTKPAEGSTEKVVEREIPFETTVIYDDTLEAGSQIIENEGKPGKENVTITTKITDGNGETSETSETVTEKEDRVVRIGVKPVTKETELPNDIEFKHNPDLKAGETKVIEEGSKGFVKYTTKFNKETGKLEITEERTGPTNKLIEYGSKTEGKVVINSDIPFEVKIIEDPEMEAGKTEVVQEGELGKKETTITIENSKEVSREEKTLTEPTKKIIKVGTKNVCEIPPVDSEDPKPNDPKPNDPKPNEPGKDKPNKPSEPGNKTPNKPGDNTPSEKPENHTPGNNAPITPETDNRIPSVEGVEPPEFNEKDSNKISETTVTEEKGNKDSKVENSSEDSKESLQGSPEKPDTEDLVDSEKKSDSKDVREEKKENLEDDNLVKNKGIERQVTKDDKAPKTGDAGIALETASAGLASGLLLLLKRFKRRKEDEE